MCDATFVCTLLFLDVTCITDASPTSPSSSVFPLCELTSTMGSCVSLVTFLFCSANKRFRGTRKIWSFMVLIMNQLKKQNFRPPTPLNLTGMDPPWSKAYGAPIVGMGRPDQNQVGQFQRMFTPTFQTKLPRSPALLYPRSRSGRSQNCSVAAYQSRFGRTPGAGTAAK